MRARFRPDPRIRALVEKYGANRVGIMFGLNADAVRRYDAGVSQRTTQWWFELHLERVISELDAEDRDHEAEHGDGPKLVLVRSPSSPPRGDV